MIIGDGFQSGRSRGRAATVIRLLRALGAAGATVSGTDADKASLVLASGRRARASVKLIDALVREDLVARTGERRLVLTEAGLARLTRAGAVDIDGFTAQHAELRDAVLMEEGEPRRVVLNDGESPLIWLHRRAGPDGAPMISAVQLAAGERLRLDLTRAQIMPRVTSNWSTAVASGRRDGEAGVATDAMIAARQRVDQAMRAVGTEFAGLLIDVCGFLKRLPEVERERGWPARSAKLVLDMALSRLARHYGLASEATGPARGAMRAWADPGYRPSVEGARA